MIVVASVGETVPRSLAKVTRVLSATGFWKRSTTVAVKVLRDDKVASGTPPGSYGIGYTTLAVSLRFELWKWTDEAGFAPIPAEPQMATWVVMSERDPNTSFM